MTTPASLSLPTLVIGPESGGRGFRVLARSSDLALDPAAQARLTEAPLALAEWAGHGENGFVARLPLSPQFSLLMRGRNFGLGTGGNLAFAHAVLLTDGAVHAAGLRGPELLASIPEPDGSLNFAERPLGIPQGPATPPEFSRDWAQLGLDWSRTVLFVPQPYPVETVLASVLMATQVEAWATSLYLRTENISPQDIFHLFVLPDSQRIPQTWTHRVALVTPSGLQGESLAVPESWQGWQVIQGLAAKTPAWSQAMARAVLVPPNFRDDAEAVKQLRGILFRMVKQLDRATTLDYLLELIRVSRRMSGAFLPAMTRDVIEFVFNESSLDDGRVYLAELARHGALSLPYIRRRFLAPGLARRLAQDEFRQLVAAGYIDDLMADPEVAPQRLDDLMPWQWEEIQAALEAPGWPRTEDSDALILDLILRRAGADRAPQGLVDRIRLAARSYLGHQGDWTTTAKAVQGLTRYVRTANSYRDPRR